MKYKPDEEAWMAYLYGELGEDEKRRFDQYILDNPDAGRELDRFHQLRRMMSAVEDKEVIAPPIVIGDRAGGEGRQLQRFWTTSYFRAAMTAAACVLVVIVVGRLAGVELVISDREVRLSFGKDVSPSGGDEGGPAMITEADVREMIDASLEKNNEAMQASLEQTQRKLDASIRSNLALNSDRMDQLVRQASTASREEISEFAERMRAENLEQVKEYFQLTSTEQKQYIENLLVDFAKYLQQQRNDDLQLVQTRMNSLEQNSVLFRQETEQILSSIITTVGTPISGETKN